MQNTLSFVGKSGEVLTSWGFWGSAAHYRLFLRRCSAIDVPTYVCPATAAINCSARRIRVELSGGVTPGRIVAALRDCCHRLQLRGAGRGEPLGSVCLVFGCAGSLQNGERCTVRSHAHVNTMARVAGPVSAWSGRMRKQRVMSCCLCEATSSVSPCSCRWLNHAVPLHEPLVVNCLTPSAAAAPHCARVRLHRHQACMRMAVRGDGRGWAPRRL